MGESGEERRDVDDYLLLLKAKAKDNDLAPAVSSLLQQCLSVDSNYDSDHPQFSTFCLLKKASIIYSIRQATTGGSLRNPDFILDSIQIIEQLDRQQGIPIPDSMASSFRALAVHCTLSCLSISLHCYFDAVRRIWHTQIPNLEKSGSTLLIDPGLPKWRDDIEAALWDDDTSQRLLRINTHDEAVRRIRVYLEEAHFSMKPAFLRLALVPSAQLPSPPSPDKSKKSLGVNSRRRCKLRSFHRFHNRPVIITDSENQPTPNNGTLSTANIDNRPQDALKSTTTNLLAEASNPLSKTFSVSERVAPVKTVKNLHSQAIVDDCNKDKGVPATSVLPTMDVAASFVNATEETTQAKRMGTDMTGENLHVKAIGEGQSKMDASNGTAEFVKANEAIEGNQDFIQQNEVDKSSLMERNGTAQVPTRPHRCTDKGKGILRVNSQTRYKLGSSHRHHRGPAIIADSDRPSCSKYHSLSTPEINKLRDALKSSTAELLAAVTDPLPEALEVAERVSKSFNPTVDVPATVVNPTMEPAQAAKNLHEKSIEEGNSKDNGALPSSVNPTSEPAQARENGQPNQASLHQNKVLKRSLMDRNDTARTYQWEDSIEVSDEGISSSSVRCHLPSPNIKHVSPLKEGVAEKWARKRKLKRWTVEEEEALVQGTRKYGKSWKLILASNPEAFRNRTAVDLKDKWRNMAGR